jgi:hypothetical protein
MVNNLHIKWELITAYKWNKLFAPQVNTNNYSISIVMNHFFIWEDKWINFQKFMLINLEIVSNKFSDVSFEWNLI